MPKKLYTIFFDKEKCRGHVFDADARSLENRWYGTRLGNTLELALEEIVYLLLRGDAQVRDQNTIYKSFEELLRAHSTCFKKMFWARLVVYKDLRDRGRRVRPLGDKFLVKHKDGSIRLVIVLQEKTPIETEKLSVWSRQALSNNLILVLAMVSFQGDLTYYEVSKIEPKRE